MTDQVTDTIIVKGKVGDIYALWSDFTNFPHFMENIESVTPRGPNRTRWVMKGPLGSTFEWDATTTRMDENSRIAWQSTDGTLKTSGQVTFKQLPKDETQVTATIHYVPPAGTIGQVAADLFGKPKERLIKDLRNFKAWAESRNRILSTSV